MSQYNLKTKLNIDEAYNSGLLPQRNGKNLYYRDRSCRSNLSQLQLSSENRRILRKTEGYTYRAVPLDEFDFNPSLQKTIHTWIKTLNWDFPTSSLKIVFKNHIFNQVIIWSDQDGKIIAYAIVYTSSEIAHIAYLFYDPDVSHQDILIRIVLQFVIDCHKLGLKYAYLGRFSPESGYYKRNMPGFEYYQDNSWKTKNHDI